MKLYFLFIFILIYNISCNQNKEDEKMIVVGANKMSDNFIKKLTEKAANHIFGQAIKTMGMEEKNDVEKDAIIIETKNNLFDEDDDDNTRIWFLIFASISIPCFLFVSCIFCYYFIWKYSVHFLWLIFVIIFATIIITFLLLYTLK